MPTKQIFVGDDDHDLENRQVIEVPCDGPLPRAMTENAKINTVLRALFAMPISAEQRLSAFFLWGMLQPEDVRATEKGRRRASADALEAKNPGQRRKWAADYAARNPERLREYHRNYYVENVDEHKSQSREWRRANVETIRLQKREAYAQNKESHPKNQVLSTSISRSAEAMIIRGSSRARVRNLGRSPE